MHTSYCVMGDIHGQLDQFALLLQKANLVGTDGRWSGGEQELWLIGDYANRGPDGIGVIEWIMRLEEQAQAAGGRVNPLLGNHDVLLLCAYFLGDQDSGGPSGTFRGDWLRNGGSPRDLERLTSVHIEWLTRLPALAASGDDLFAHADSMLYFKYGSDLPSVNRAFWDVLNGRDPLLWDSMLDDFSDRLAFWSDPGQLTPFLTTYEAKRLIHGHTPIQIMTDAASHAVTSAFHYANGRCVNVDGGLYLGGQGFLYRA